MCVSPLVAVAVVVVVAAAAAALGQNDEVIAKIRVQLPFLAKLPPAGSLRKRSKAARESEKKKKKKRRRKKNVLLISREPQAYPFHNEAHNR